MLTGKAKSDYMRDYMRKRRAEQKAGKSGTPIHVPTAVDYSGDDREARQLLEDANKRAAILAKIADAYTRHDRHKLEGNRIYNTYDEAGNCDEDAADVEWHKAFDAKFAALDMVVDLIKIGNDRGEIHDLMHELIARAMQEHDKQFPYDEHDQGEWVLQ